MLCNELIYRIEFKVLSKQGMELKQLKCPACGKLDCWTEIPENDEWVRYKCGKEVHLYLHGNPYKKGEVAEW